MSFYCAKNAASLSGSLVYVKSSTENQIVLAWNLPAGGYDNGGAKMLNWNVYVTPDKDLYPTLTTLETFNSDIHEVTFPCPTPKVYYFFKVAAKTVAGPGDSSDGRRFRCSPLPEAPDPP